MQKTPTLRKKNEYACLYILTSVNTIIKQKINNYACIYNKYAQNGAFTNDTPYKLMSSKCQFLFFLLTRGNHKIKNNALRLSHIFSLENQ